LTAQGVTVLRIAAADILRDLPAVVDHIISHSQRLLPLHHSPPASGPPPRAGEECLVPTHPGHPCLPVRLCLWRRRR
jgi:hypothetical protein